MIIEHPPAQFHLTKSGRRIAYRQQSGTGPGFLWLGGYASDMLGTKAAFIDDWTCQKGRAYVRFDYFGHGESEGDFEEGGIGDWTADALDILDHVAIGQQVLIGSSMGGWVACLLAKLRPERLAGMIFIAPAPDFATELMWPSWDRATQDQVMTEGRIAIPSEYDDSEMVYTRKLIEDGRQQRVLDQPLQVNCPVHILQGMQDTSVPWQHAMRLADHIDAPSVDIEIVKNSDHRMSSELDLLKLRRVLEQF